MQVISDPSVTLVAGSSVMQPVAYWSFIYAISSSDYWYAAEGAFSRTKPNIACNPEHGKQMSTSFYKTRKNDIWNKQDKNCLEWFTHGYAWTNHSVVVKTRIGRGWSDQFPCSHRARVDPICQSDVSSCDDVVAITVLYVVIFFCFTLMFNWRYVCNMKSCDGELWNFCIHYLNRTDRTWDSLFQARFHIIPWFTSRGSVHTPRDHGLYESTAGIDQVFVNQLLI